MNLVGRLIGAFLFGFLGCLLPVLVESEWAALPGGLGRWIAILGGLGFVLGLLTGDPLLRLLGQDPDDSG